MSYHMRQEHLVAKHLHDIGTLSGREAEDLYRIRDLPKRVSVLRGEGHDIVRVLKTDAMGQRYARYAYRRNEGLLASRVPPSQPPKPPFHNPQG